jgi:hypothetical protein
MASRSVSHEIATVNETSSTPRMTLGCAFEGAFEGEPGTVVSQRTIPDTGAARTVLPLAAVPAGATISPSSARLTAANGTKFVTTGTVTFLGRVAAGPRVPIKAVVTPDLTGPPLVGWRDLQALGVLPRAFPSVGQEVLGLDVDVLCLGGEDAVNMVLVDEGDPLSLGVGTDSLDKIKMDYKAVLVTSLGTLPAAFWGPRCGSSWTTPGTFGRSTSRPPARCPCTFSLWQGS